MDKRTRSRSSPHLNRHSEDAVFAMLYAWVAAEAARRRQARYRHDLKTFIIPFTIITALHVAAIIYATLKILLAN